MPADSGSRNAVVQYSTNIQSVRRLHWPATLGCRPAGRFAIGIRGFAKQAAAGSAIGRRRGTRAPKGCRILGRFRPMC